MIPLQRHLTIPIFCALCTGNAGDSLSYHLGPRALSTKDRDNDGDDSYVHSCATAYKGAWYYGKCTESSLNSVYHHGSTSREGGTHESFVRGGSAPRSNPLPFYIPFFVEKETLPYTFHSLKMYPFLIPTERLFAKLFNSETPLRRRST